VQPTRIATSWTRLDYLAHRWTGTALGAMVFVWFASGIAMLYYPEPRLTESRELAILRPFEPDSTLVGFRRAWTAAARALRGAGTEAGLVSGRLRILGDRPVYQFQRDYDGEAVPAGLVDARSGEVLSPVSPALAVAAARDLVGAGPKLVGLDLLRRGDQYMMNGEYAAEFPAYRVRFDDAHRSAVYVSSRGGNPFGLVTRLTRFTTWTGTVPHWLYFRWLYDRYALWNGTIVLAGSAGVLLGLTGIVWGTTQLARRRRQGGRPLPAYRGLSRWHHLAGLTFGVLVVTWCLSGVWENLGSGSSPRPGQPARIRGGATHWEAIRLSEAEALSRFRASDGSPVPPVAVDLVQFDGRPGFELHLADGRAAWVDATTGEPRGEIPETALIPVARRVMGDSVPIQRAERIVSYDDYYYARHGREMHLPAWRVTFGDREASRLYLDPVSGRPTGFVDRASRRSRWMRDALHSLDFRALALRRPLWDVVMLTLLAGGLLSSGSGVLLVIRRFRRTGGRADRRTGGRP
jgi:hypothetical protein